MTEKQAFSLNAAQQAAASSFYGPMLCIAGAGTGKTRTLVHRVAKMLDAGIAPESILLLTFTRNAAQSMLEQTAAIIGADALKVAGGTYHAFATQLIAKHAAELGLHREFNIISDDDAADLIELIRTEKLPHIKGLPSKRRLQALFSGAFNLELSLPEYLQRFPLSVQGPDPDLNALELLHDELALYKQQNHLLDYDDLLFFLHHLLSQFPTLRQQINQQYQFIMVDEYQDTNLLQGKITHLLAGPAQNLMVVGDDSQCIYSFRGAYVQNILSFPTLYPQCQIIKLEQNYRSLNSILTLANGLMSAKSARAQLPAPAPTFQKNLFSHLGQGLPPVLAVCSTEHLQARFILSRIAHLHSQGVPLSEMAVLFRAAYHSELLELELARHGIPYHKWGGKRFLDSKHLRDFLALLKLVNNPQDILSWLRVLCLIKGVGKRTAEALIDKIQLDYSISKGYQFPNQLIKASVTSLLTCLQKASQHKWNKLELVLALVSDYYSVTYAELYPEFNKKLKDLDYLVVLAEPYTSLQDFLSNLALDPPAPKATQAPLQGQPLASAPQGSLTLSTIHSAKGLEWHSVFVMSVIDGLFPYYRSDDDLNQRLCEERRLLYVAMTRAKANLTLSYPLNFTGHSMGSNLLRKSSLLHGLEPFLATWQIKD